MTTTPHTATNAEAIRARMSAVRRSITDTGTFTAQQQTAIGHQLQQVGDLLRSASYKTGSDPDLAADLLSQAQDRMAAIEGGIR